MLEVGSVVHLRFSNDSENRGIVKGSVLAATANDITVEFHEPVELSVDAGVHLLYRLDNEFIRGMAIVQSVLREEPSLQVRLLWVGQPYPCKVRGSFRVAAHFEGLRAKLGAASVWLVDLSFDGFSVWSQQHYELGANLEAVLYYGEKRYGGEACIRNIRDLGEGRRRYGLLVSDNSLELKKGLQEITMAIQRQKLKKIARGKR